MSPALAHMHPSSAVTCFIPSLTHFVGLVGVLMAKMLENVAKIGINATVDGRNAAPVDRWFIPLFIGFQPSKVAQVLFHPQ